MNAATGFLEVTAAVDRCTDVVVAVVMREHPGIDEAELRRAMGNELWYAAVDIASLAVA